MTGSGGPAEHPATFDRRNVYYRPHPSRLHPHIREGGAAHLKIALIGDSFTYGSANDWDDAYGRRLERLLNLNEKTPPAEVRIWAERGSATVQQVKYLRRAVEYEADLVILGIFLNDTEQPGDQWLGLSRKLRRPQTPTGWALPLLRTSRALAWLYQRYENQRSRREQRAYIEYIFDPEYTGWKRFVSALETFDEITEEEDIPFVAVVFPGLGNLSSSYNRSPHEKIGAELERLGVPTLDLADSLVEKAAVRMAAYPKIDTHPSEIAHRIAAHAIFDFLLQRGLVDPAYRPEVSRVNRSEDFWLGRLRRMESPIYADP